MNGQVPGVGFALTTVNSSSSHSLNHTTVYNNMYLVIVYDISIEVATTKSPTTITTTITTTTTTTSTTTTTLLEMSSSVNLLSSCVWLGVVRNGDNHFYYVNDENQKVNSEVLFTDHTATNVDGKCAAILPDTDNPSKFHLHALDCNAKAKALCRANATTPLPGEDLPRIPCVQMTSRKKREAENGQCNNAEGSDNTCESIINGKEQHLSLRFILTGFHVHCFPAG